MTNIRHAFDQLAARRFIPLAFLGWLNRGPGDSRWERFWQFSMAYCLMVYVAIFDGMKKLWFMQVLGVLVMVSAIRGNYSLMIFQIALLVGEFALLLTPRYPTGMVFHTGAPDAMSRMIDDEQLTNPCYDDNPQVYRHGL